MARVYALYDGNGDLLYVGSTKNPSLRRIGWHLSQQPWGGDVRWIQLAPVESVSDARAEELASIHALCPKHNLVGHRNQKPRMARRQYDPEPGMFRKHRQWWLDPLRSEQDKLADISADYGQEVTRGICNGRFGWPGNEKEIPEDMAQ